MSRKIANVLWAGTKEKKESDSQIVNLEKERNWRKLKNGY